jgi:hypothetical protein
MDALVRYYFKIDTDFLDENKFLQLYSQLQWVLEKKNNNG